MHPGLCTQKGNKFPKIGSSTKFYVKNSSDITKRGAAETNKERGVQWRRREGLHRFLFCKSRAKERFFSFIIVHYFYNKSEDISRTIFN